MELVFVSAEATKLLIELVIALLPSSQPDGPQPALRVPGSRAILVVLPPGFPPESNRPNLWIRNRLERGRGPFGPTPPDCVPVGGPL
jgi:hypothetical protein